MKWYNAQRDKLPKGGETVLISVKGINYIAVFHADKRAFKLEEELKETFFKVDDYLIYWTEFVKPPDLR